MIFSIPQMALIIWDWLIMSPAADSHQQVFVICHSHHLMGNHLTDGYDPVKLSPERTFLFNSAVIALLYVPAGRFRNNLFRHNADILPCHFSSYDLKTHIRDCSEKSDSLFSRHLPVCPHRRHNPNFAFPR